MGASGKKGMVHSGREQHAAQGKENGSGKGVHATTLETCELENYCFIHLEGQGGGGDGGGNPGKSTTSLFKG